MMRRPIWLSLHACSVARLKAGSSGSGRRHYRKTLPAEKWMSPLDELPPKTGYVQVQVVGDGRIMAHYRNNLFINISTGIPITPARIICWRDKKGVV